MLFDPRRSTAEPPVISVRGLGKHYRLSHKAASATAGPGHDTLAEGLRGLLRRRSTREEFWAVRGVDFDVREGETLGIVGRNGAGKSTLLKLLSRITRPSEGGFELRGRVGSLLEVGTGFHPELTGRENIFLNGAILGMTRREVKAKFDEIVAFSGVERFLDTPVKRYSSGMYVRLAFGVAAHLEPEVLIVDEVLAVGDAEFQKKCLGKMKDVAGSGRTVLFVSHNMTAVRGLCERVIWLDGGRVREDGPAGGVVDRYLARAVTAAASVDLTDHPGRAGGMRPCLRRVEFLAEGDAPAGGIPVGGTLRFRVLIEPPESSEPLQSPVLGCVVSRQDGGRVFAAHSRDVPGPAGALDLGAGPSWVECELPGLALSPGWYAMKLSLGGLGPTLDSVEDAAHFEVLPTDYFGTGRLPDAGQGPLVQRSRWRVTPATLGGGPAS